MPTFHTSEQLLYFQDHQLQVKTLTPEQLKPELPTLVLLHDSLGCISLWRDFPEKLAERTGLEVMLYDRRGYGNSTPFANTARQPDYLAREADALHELLQQLQISKAILFGHSDGGSIALLTAAKYPETIAGIVTEGAHVFVEEITLAGIRSAVQAYQQTNLPQKLLKYHGDKTDAVFRAWADIWLSDRFWDWNIELFLPAILCPSLIIQGEEDEYGTLAQVDAIVEQVRGPAQKLIIPKVGHTPHREATQQVLTATVDFILLSILSTQV